MRTPIAARAGLLAGLLALLLTAAGCSGAGGSDSGDAPTQAAAVGTAVTAKGNRFQPQALQVAAGTAVVWTFDDGAVPHDVSGDGWSSGAPKSSGTFTHTFDRPGTYAYRCTIHPGMTGQVIVTPS
jgi:plastocyanin